MPIEGGGDGGAWGSQAQRAAFGGNHLGLGSVPTAQGHCLCQTTANDHSGPSLPVQGPCRSVVGWRKSFMKRGGTRRDPRRDILSCCCDVSAVRAASPFLVILRPKTQSGRRGDYFPTTGRVFSFTTKTKTQHFTPCRAGKSVCFREIPNCHFRPGRPAPCHRQDNSNLRPLGNSGRCTPTNDTSPFS